MSIARKPFKFSLKTTEQSASAPGLRPNPSNAIPLRRAVEGAGELAGRGGVD